MWLVCSSKPRGSPTRRSLELCGLILGLGLFASALAQMTESPTVVPVGQCWIEMDAAAWGHDRHTPARDATRYQQFDMGAVLVTWGVRQNWDVQLGWAGWTYAEEKSGPVGRQSQSARGDSWLRAKWNFRGDEAEEPAWALLPYLKIPTADDAIGNGHWEPGVALVYGAPWADGKCIEAMVSVDALRSEWGGASQFGLRLRLSVSSRVGMENWLYRMSQSRR